MTFVRQPHCGADLARGAVAALEGIMADEGALQGVQFAAAGQPFDSYQVGAFAHDGEGEACIDALAITQYRAGPTLAVIAAFLGAYQVQLLTQQVEQRCPGQDQQ